MCSGTITGTCHISIVRLRVNNETDCSVNYLSLNRVAGTMVARSSSVRVIAHLNPSQVPPLHMHVGKWPAAKRLACVVPEVDLREYTLHLPPQKVNKADPTLALKPRGDMTRNPK